MRENTDAYLDLQKKRADGSLPEMGSACRVSEIIANKASHLEDEKLGIDILDVGCAAGHYYRSLIKRNLHLRKYTGLEVDVAMVSAANQIWSQEIREKKMCFINNSIEDFNAPHKFDFVMCINAFMYFSDGYDSLRRLMRISKKYLIIRSYFTNANYRIMRAQTSQNHDKSLFKESEIFDDNGNMRCYDFWNMYSFSYIESAAKRIDSKATVEWIADNNILSSIEEEQVLNIQKRGATEIVGNEEVVYPFFLPWKYLVINLNN